MNIFNQILKNNDLYKINNSIESQNIFLDCNNYDVKDLYVESNVGGRNFILSIDPKIEQTKLLLLNPFLNNNNNEKIGIQIGPDGLLSNTRLITYYQDKFGNTLSISKSSENPFGNSSFGKSIFKIEEASLSYSFSLFKQIFSIISSDCSTIIGDRNNSKIHKAHTGTSFKTSVQHICKIKEDISNSLLCKLHSEFSIPYLSSCSFFKSQIFFSKMFNFKNTNGFTCRLDGSIGKIFNFNSNKMLVPLNDRFFNGKNYGFPGFQKSSLSDQISGSSFLGSTSYFTFRSTLFKEINSSISSVLYFNIGGFNLSNNCKNSNNNSINNNNKNNNNNNNISNNFISNLKNSIRSSIGLGFSFNYGNSLILISLVKPINYSVNDRLRGSSIEILYKS